MSRSPILIVFFGLCLVGQYALGQQSSPNNSASGDIMTLLLAIIISGAIGGFVDGMIVAKEYKFRLPIRMLTKDEKQKENNITSRRALYELGSLGDIFVGMTASIAIFSVAGSFFGLDLNNFWGSGEKAVRDTIRVIALGVLSGFTGIRLLRGLSEKMVEDIADKAATKAVKREIRRDTESTLTIKAADTILQRFDINAEKEKLFEPISKIENEKLKGFHSQLNRALQTYEIVLGDDPYNEEALRGKAKVFKRRAQLFSKQGEPDKAKEKWHNAINTLDLILKANRNSSYALYNRACYLSAANLSPEQLDEAIDNLADALKLDSLLKELAKDEDDFANLKEEKEDEFKKLLL